MEISFEKIISSESIPLNIKDLYTSSFPEEERRPWNDIVQRIDNHDPFFSFYVLQHKDEKIGFITLWRLPNALYCEHFAIFPGHRGNGYGTAVISMAADMAATLLPSGDGPLVLEVELPEKSAEAARRVEFYKRCGLIPLESFPYWQPPYRHDLPEVAMMLMSSRLLTDPTSLVLMLHTLVYNA